MEITKATLSGVVFASLLIGGGAVYFFKLDNEHEVARDSISAPMPLAPIEQVELQQDGKDISLPEFFSTYRKNPNRFKLLTEKSQFRVQGKIAKVDEADDVIDKISGFHLPLKAPLPIELNGQKGPGTISLFVKGLSKDELSALDINDSVNADCPKVRAFNESLAFDDCVLRKAEK